MLVRLGEDDGAGTWGERGERTDLRGADPGAKDGGGTGAERRGNNDDGSRWG